MSDTKSVEEAPVIESKYAFTRGLAAGRKIMERSTLTINALALLLAPLVVVGSYFSLDFMAGHIHFLVAMAINLTVVVALFLGAFRLGSYLVVLALQKKAVEKLAGDPLAAHIAQGLNIPEDFALALLGNTISSYSGKWDNVHDDMLVKMKIIEEWDDLRARYVSYIRVRVQKPHDVMSDLIVVE